MRKVKQLITHDPANGQWGDCFRTALACLLDLDPLEVPHFCDGGGGSDRQVRKRVRHWLGQRGYDLFCVAFPCELDELMRTMGCLNPGVPWLLMGTSRTGCNHNVICRGSEIVWDPSPTDSGIVAPADDGYYWVDVLVRKGEET